MRNLLSFSLLLTTLTASAITPEEAMTFLYSTLSLPDKMDYSEDFYRRNVEASLQTREEMPWGKDIPDREFLHFVLPVRVNNESLDLSRLIFYDELRDRVKDLPMKDAILEVNHWCHEKATYKPSDSRTSSPLSTVSQAIGRCGEESTFTVAALRAVGIPARQIYTPRWAHTDDNHAWVEAWADGEWHFLGACEPEAMLDLAWFNAPASRGMLMSTNVAGVYDGPEEVLLREPFTTRINVTSNYAPVATLPVKVVYPDGSPVNGANVNFCIYNYSEYYPAVTKVTDVGGNASLTCGLGDMVVWATDGTRFGFAKGSGSEYAEGSPLTVVLDKEGSFEGVVEYDIVPPASKSAVLTVSSAQRAINDRRLAHEDSIRNHYVATFITPDKAADAAARLGVNRDKLVKILTESRGNYRTILQSLETTDPMRREKVIDLLDIISEKDRRDIPMNVISDHVVSTIGYAMDPDDDNFTDDVDFLGMERECFTSYVLNPRIEMEALTPWRSILREHFPMEQLTDFRKNPEKVAKWVSDSIAVTMDENPARLRMSPEGVLKAGKADPLSRNIFFVALARTAGVPARIDPVTGATQYAVAKTKREKEDMDPLWYKWVTVDLDRLAMDSGSTDKPNSGKDPQEEAKATLSLSFTPEGYVNDPKYYSQFSLSRIIDGVPVLLEYAEESTLRELFNTPQEVVPGQYILTSGQRLADGSVLARSEIFTIAPGEKAERELTIRQAEGSVSVIGSLNAENIYHDLATDTDKSLLSTTGRGYYIVVLASPGHEPTAHALNDISAAAKRLEEQGNKIIVLFEDMDKAMRFDETHFPNLPSTVVFGIDKDGSIRKEITGSLHMTEAEDPIIVVADTFNRIVMASSGYAIGTGERLLSTLDTLSTQ